MKIGYFCNITNWKKKPYTEILDDARDIADYCDKNNWNSIWFTEHHFNHEGMEAQPNPLMMCTDIAARTKQIRLGQACNVITFWNPIRLAEDIAALDQLSKGRVEVGIGRGVYGREAVHMNIEADLKDGKIQQISSPDVLYEKPENAFVANFIGENNQLKGKVKSINGKNCVVTTDQGDDITSLKINVNSVGDRSTVSLRPERVEINSPDSNFENSFNAKVKELIYLGDHIRTRVEVCGNDQFIVKVPNSYKGANLKEGASVKLSWKASDSRALDLG